LEKKEAIVNQSEKRKKFAGGQGWLMVSDGVSGGGLCKVLKPQRSMVKMGMGRASHHICYIERLLAVGLLIMG
jgi:hypothetical protein